MVFSVPVQYLRGIKGVIGLAPFYKFLGMVQIESFSFTLAIGPKFPFLAGAFIKRDPAPFQSFYDIGLRPFHKTILIGILYAQQKIPLMFFGKEIVEQGGAQPSYVQRPRGTGSKSYPNFIIHASVFCCKDTVPQRS